MNVDQVLESAESAVSRAGDEASLEAVRVQFLGRKGELTALLKSLGRMDAAERPKAGAAINAAKERLQASIADRKKALIGEQLAAEVATETVDVTLPGRRSASGGLHPVTQVIARVEGIFTGAGYDVVAGLEIEDDYHNFEALNIPHHHPARSMHDTFYFADGTLLRTHTSPARCMSWSLRNRRYG